MSVSTERMMQWFTYTHLPMDLQSVSKPFCKLAEHIVATLDPGPERTVALRKLLEAKDAAERARLEAAGPFDDRDKPSEGKA